MEMEYYRCENPDCGFVAENQEPDVCPRCGETFFLSVPEEELTASDWVTLGNQAVEEKRGSEALAFYQQAAARGDALGLTNLGWCLEAGIGVEADPAQAVLLYAQAAAMNYMPALTNLGYCYTYGIGVKQDEAKALECFQKGAQQGFPRAQFLLGGGIPPGCRYSAGRSGGSEMVSVRGLAGVSGGPDGTGTLL